MKAKITQAFRFAIGGIHVVDVNVGDVVDGRCAEVALQEKWGIPADPPAKTPAPVEPPAATAPVSTQLPPVTPSWTESAAKPAQKPGKKGR